jgi:MFS transporter, FHS family, glucose/mannose:H+ symporter
MISGIPQQKISQNNSASRAAIITSGTALVHFDFLLTGMVMTFLGPMLPILSARWSITDEKSGSLYFVQFFTSMFGMLLSNTLVQRLGYRTTFMLGLALMSCGMVLLGSGPYAAGIVSVAIMGFGYGITTPAGNLRTAELDPERSAAALNVINAVWGIGAMSSPFLLAIAQRAHRPAWFLYGTAAGLVALLIALALVRFNPDHRAISGDSHGPTGPFRISRRVLLIGGLFFIYVGTETSFGAWVATYAHRLSPADRTWWAVIPSFYWGALLVGRSVAPLVLRRKSAVVVAIGDLSIALLGGAALAFARGASMVVVGSVLAGLGLASIFPISVSLLPRWFGATVRRVSGPVFGCGNVGGAVLPWVVGVISTHSGSLRLGFFVPLFGVAAMLAFYAAQTQAQKRPTPPSGSGRGWKREDLHDRGIPR